MRITLLIFLLISCAYAESYDGVDTVVTGDLFDFSSPDSCVDGDLLISAVSNGIYPSGTVVQSTGRSKSFHDFGRVDFSAVSSAPAKGYISHIKKPAPENLYCIITLEGYYVKLRIRELSILPPQYELKWTYQDNKSASFK